MNKPSALLSLLALVALLLASSVPVAGGVTRALFVASAGD